MFDQLLRDLARAFDAAGIPYMVIGGQAVLAYGEYRFTRDIDVTLGVDTDRLAEVLAVTDGLGLSPLVDPHAFVPDYLILPCKDDESGIRVDLIFSFSAFEREAIKRAHDIIIQGETVRYASPEDLIIQKIVAGRPQDSRDVQNVLLKNPDVDSGYILGWLKQMEAAVETPLVDTFQQLYRETRS